MEFSPEKSLWFLFVKGDLNAFSGLFKHFYPMLHNYGVKISGNKELTEDCLQNFFVYLFENKNKLENVLNVKSYLYISFRRYLFKHIKKEKKHLSYDDLFESNKDFVFSVEEIHIQQEIFLIKNKALTTLINSLSTREREAIYLKYYSLLTTKEISEVMNITYQSVQNTLQKAFVKLRNKSESKALQHILNP